MDDTRTAERGRELEEYETLLDRAERLRPSGLHFAELRRLGLLYRRHATALARARESSSDPDRTRHLNALSVRAYTLLYGRRSRRHTPRADARRFAIALARSWTSIRIAFALTAIGAVLGAALVSRDTELLWAIVPTSLGYQAADLERLALSPDAQAEFLAHESIGVGRQTLMGSTLFAHNTRVGITALATGMLAGIPTVLLTLYNGLVLGAFASIFVGGPSTVDFFAWMLPHAVPELSAIMLCAAGGLQLGAAVAAPGRRGRRRALREALDSALVLFGIALPLFLVAGILESFVRESTLATSTRLAIAASALAAGVALAFGLRTIARRNPVEADWLAELRHAAE